MKHWTGKTPINKSVLGAHHFIPFENDSSKCRQEEEIK